MKLVLSLFTGIGLLDKAFLEAGFCVVSAGDLITGQDIRDFTGVKNKFDGVIGGSPCQDFSTLKRDKGSYSLDMMHEFLRVVGECEPSWYLLENVRGVPNVTELLKNCVITRNTYYDVVNQNISVRTLEKYSHQRININQGWYDNYSRLRHIQFGSKDDLYLDVPRGTMKNIISGCALASDDRSFKELCHIQGLEKDFDLPDFNVKGKKKAVGNGVPLSMGSVIALAIKNVTGPGQITVNDRVEKSVTQQQNKNVTDRNIKRCACGCGRELIGRQKTSSDRCRKALSRNKQ